MGNNKKDFQSFKTFFVAFLFHYNYSLGKRFSSALSDSIILRTVIE